MSNLKGHSSDYLVATSEASDHRYVKRTVYQIVYLIH